MMIAGPATVNEGDTYTLALASYFPSAFTVSEWDVNWGDGSAVETFPEIPLA